MGISATPYPTAGRISTLVVDADLDLKDYNAKVNHFTESTPGHGIVINNLLAPALGVTIAAGQILSVDHIRETTGAHRVVDDTSFQIDGGLYVNHVYETSGGHNIVLDNIVNYDGMMFNALASLGFNPADSTTYYFGGNPAVGITATALLHRIYFAKAAVIRRADINWYEGTIVGTNEDISMYIRLNDTTDTLIQTKGAAAASKVFSNAALNIAVAAGDFIELKIVTPAWATNPTNVCVGGVVYAG